MRQIYEHHPVIGYKFVPNIKARQPHVGGGYLVRTNSMGFQCDHEFTKAKTPGKRRILMFGDSFTAGEGVSNGYRFSDHLERLIPDLEIYNFGLPASGTGQHYLLYKEFAQEFEHDLLVICVFVENIRRVASRYRRWGDANGKPVIYAKPYFLLENEQLKLHGVPAPKEPLDPDALGTDQQFVAATARFPRLKELFKKVQAQPFGRALIERGFKDMALKLMRYQPMKEYDDPNNPGWLVMRAILQQWIREHEQPALLMPIPLSHYVAEISDPTAYQTRLREAAQGAGGSFLPTLPGLKTVGVDARKNYFFEDGHLTKTGHQALAEGVAPAIQRLLDTPV